MILIVSRRAQTPHYPESYWNELADWLFSALYLGVCCELDWRSGESTDESAVV